jgi:trans-aconitate methyltransferase
VLKERPFDNEQGLRGVSAFALYWFLQQVQPTHVFEIGVWKGFSTWLIRRALPDARVLSFDPLVLLEVFLDPAKIGATYRDPNVSYSFQDFSCADLSPVVAESSCALAFFDDHQNKLPRLMQAKNFGIKHVIFDDNDAACSTHRTLEEELAEAESATRLSQLVARYEVFPALWDIDALINGVLKINETGLGFPVTEDVMEVYKDRDWHSYVTYVQLR